MTIGDERITCIHSAANLSRGNVHLRLDDWAAFILPDFEVVDGVVRFRPNSTGKQFHKEDLRLIDFKIDQWHAGRPFWVQLSSNHGHGDPW